MARSSTSTCRASRCRRRSPRSRSSRRSPMPGEMPDLAAEPRCGAHVEGGAPTRDTASVPRRARNSDRARADRVPADRRRRGHARAAVPAQHRLRAVRRAAVSRRAVAERVHHHRRAGVPRALRADPRRRAPREAARAKCAKAGAGGNSSGFAASRMPRSSRCSKAVTARRASSRRRRSRFRIRRRSQRSSARAPRSRRATTTAAAAMLDRPDAHATNLAVPRLMLEAEIALERGSRPEALGAPRRVAPRGGPAHRCAAARVARADGRRPTR